MEVAEHGGIGGAGDHARAFMLRGCVTYDARLDDGSGESGGEEGEDDEERSDHFAEK